MARRALDDCSHVGTVERHYDRLVASLAARFGQLPCASGERLNNATVAAAEAGGLRRPVLQEVQLELRDDYEMYEYARYKGDLLYGNPQRCGPRPRGGRDG